MFTLLLSLLFLVDLSQASVNFTLFPASSKLKWRPCHSRFFCARLEVPLDYMNLTNNAKVLIPLVKLPAASSVRYQGSLLHNPGGPGGSGIESAFRGVSEHYHRISGGGYDVIGFDPRGIANSLPVACCQNGDSTPQTISMLLNLQSSVPQLPPIYLPQYTANFNAHMEWLREFGKLCQESMGGWDQIGPYMTTADVARDMLTIMDAVTKEHGSREPELLNFWGASYGTSIGQTFATMFPDRVGRMVLDGVVDLQDDRRTGSSAKSTQNLDDIWGVYFRYCHLAGPENCAMYTGNSPRHIYERFEYLMLQLDVKRVVQKPWAWEKIKYVANILLVTKQLLHRTAYDPIYEFPRISSYLVGVESLMSNLTSDSFRAWKKTHPYASSNLASNSTIPVQSPQFSLWNDAIRCSDRDSIYGKTQMEIDKLQDPYIYSTIAHDAMRSEDYRCTAWPIRGKNRFTGDVGAKTKTPMLYVSNTFDPITPIANSFKLAPLFPGAQVLEIEGIGHCSGAANNKCAWRKIGEYLREGKMPDSDNFCSIETGPWGVELFYLS
ncbi:Alpha/Beta hydrolase protein [Bisporella sp. PMI_857]|nr:Alpha/Beta hydrolase protein [Bisporella sp. PMI_857]